MMYAQSGLNFSIPDIKNTKYLQNIEFFEIISSFLDLLLIIVVIASVFYLVLAGLKYITSGGDAGKTKEAQSAIMNVIIGLIVAISAYFLVQFVLKQLGVDITQLGMFSRAVNQETSVTPTPAPSGNNTDTSGTIPLAVLYVKEDGIYANSVTGTAEAKVVPMLDAYSKIHAVAWRNTEEITYAFCESECKIRTFNMIKRTTGQEYTLPLVQKLALDWSPNGERMGFLALDVFGETVAGYFAFDGQKTVLMTYPSTSPREETFTDRFTLSYTKSGKYVMYVTTFADDLTNHETVAIFDDAGSKTAKHTYPALEGSFVSDEAYIYTADKKVMQVDIPLRQSREIANNDVRIHLAHNVFDIGYIYATVNTTTKQTALHYATADSSKKITDLAHGGLFSSATNVVAYITDREATQKYPLENKGLVSVSVVNGETTTIINTKVGAFAVLQ
ncbi:MAG: pilin [Candidatus Dojkabacteria bacterium]|nr:MAG: pilin [Candidatus Dojkabacteria bacterium]